MCVCVCVCVYERERERALSQEHTFPMAYTLTPLSPALDFHFQWNTVTTRTNNHILFHITHDCKTLYIDSITFTF